jgi:uncharacterized protein
VNYLPEDGTVIFRTGPGSKTDALAAGGTVALEADGLNTYGTIAWSVVVKGQAEVVDLGANEPLPEQDPVPWEKGVKDRLVRITPGELTGRRFVVTSSPTRWWRPRSIPSPGATTIQ